MTLELTTSVKYLKGVGPKRAEALARLGIRTVGDLLYHAPHRYLDATTVTPLARASLGSEATCVGRVVTTGVLPTRRGLRVFRAVLRDASGLLECAWPGQPFLERQIKQGQLLLVTGPVRYYHGRQLVPREFIVLAEKDEDEPGRGMILPVYPATEGLSHRQIRGLLHQHLDVLLPLAADPHPEALRARVGLAPLRDALAAVHRPKETLPFELTGDQKRAVREIAEDMTAAERMHRLLMGDVGTGKTVVALFAMLLAAENGYQAAIMAPTELLAEQHHATLTRLLEPLDLRPELLIGRLTAAQKAAARERIAAGGARLVVGTHALIQESVRFHRLGLAVVDEQHRFGVEQRAALAEKGDAPDVLLKHRRRRNTGHPGPAGPPSGLVRIGPRAHLHVSARRVRRRSAGLRRLSRDRRFGTRRPQGRDRGRRESETRVRRVPRGARARPDQARGAGRGHAGVP